MKCIYHYSSEIRSHLMLFVDSVSGSSARMLNLELDFDAESGVTYKAVVDVTAYGNNGSESDSASRTKTCP